MTESSALGAKTLTERGGMCGDPTEDGAQSMNLITSEVGGRSPADVVLRWWSLLAPLQVGTQTA